MYICTQHVWLSASETSYDEMCECDTNKIFFFIEHRRDWVQQLRIIWSFLLSVHFHCNQNAYTQAHRPNILILHLTIRLWSANSDGLFVEHNLKAHNYNNHEKYIFIQEFGNERASKYVLLCFFIFSQLFSGALWACTAWKYSSDGCSATR